MAVKVIENTSSDQVKDVQKEIEILKKCKSPNIVSYFGSVFTDSALWVIFLEFSLNFLTYIF